MSTWPAPDKRPSTRASVWRWRWYACTAYSLRMRSAASTPVRRMKTFTHCAQSCSAGARRDRSACTPRGRSARSGRWAAAFRAAGDSATTSSPAMNGAHRQRPPAGSPNESSARTSSPTGAATRCSLSSKGCSRLSSSGTSSTNLLSLRFACSVSPVKSLMPARSRSFARLCSACTFSSASTPFRPSARLRLKCGAATRLAQVDGLLVLRLGFRDLALQQVDVAEVVVQRREAGVVGTGLDGAQVQLFGDVQIAVALRLVGQREVDRELVDAGVEPLLQARDLRHRAFAVLEQPHVHGRAAERSHASDAFGCPRRRRQHGQHQHREHHLCRREIQRDCQERGEHERQRPELQEHGQEQQHRGQHLGLPPPRATGKRWWTSWA